MAKNLSVTVIEGRDLAAKDKTGFSDPYVIVTVGGQKKKTKKIMQTLNPQWNEVLSFENVDDRMRVDMKCKDWDKFGGHDFMGEFSVPSSDLHEAYSGATVEKWYPLMRRKDKDVVKGDIKIKISFSTAPIAPLATTAPKSPRRNSFANLSPAEIDTKIQSLMKQREALDSMTKAYERSGDVKSAQVSAQQVAQIDGELAQLRQQAATGSVPSQPTGAAPSYPSAPLTAPSQPQFSTNAPPPPPPPGPGMGTRPTPPHLTPGVGSQPGHGVPQPGFNAPQHGFGAPQPGFGAPQPGYNPPQPGFGAPQPNVGVPQPGYGAPQPGFGGPQPGTSLPSHNPSQNRLSAGPGMTPQPPAPPRVPSSGGMLKVPQQGSTNRLSGIPTPPNTSTLPLPNHQPSERRLSGGTGGNAKFVPPRQAPPTPPGPGGNTGAPSPQPPTRNLPTPGVGPGRPMPPQPPQPHMPQKKRVRVLYDFPAENPGELHVSEGEVVEIDSADDTWFTATKNGVTGWFPTNYAELI